MRRIIIALFKMLDLCTDMELQDFLITSILLNIYFILTNLNFDFLQKDARILYNKLKNVHINISYLRIYGIFDISF